jgi:molybdate transport system substrate-binding protein
MSVRGALRLAAVAVLIGVGAIIVRATSPSTSSASLSIGHAPSGVSVLVASPLAPVVAEMAPFDRISSGTADALAAQVIEGVPADVLVVADSATSVALHAKGLTGSPVVIAHDRLVIITPPGNPARIHSVADLAGRGVRLVIGGPGSAIGRYTRQALAQLGVGAALANAVQQAADAATITTAVVLGDADAGVAYASQAHALGAKVHVVSIPTSAQPVISDTAAVLANAPHPASALAFLGYLTGPNGRAYLRRFGFAVP